VGKSEGRRALIFQRSESINLLSDGCVEDLPWPKLNEKGYCRTFGTSASAICGVDPFGSGSAKFSGDCHHIQVQLQISAQELNFQERQIAI
jgi:hypothetical protein